MVPFKNTILNQIRRRGYYVEPSEWLRMGTHLPTDLMRLGWNKNDDRVVIDVGANVGSFTSDLIAYFPRIRSHCFEPNPEVFEVLSNNLSHTRTILNNSALGARRGSAELTLGVSSEYSSLVPSEKLMGESTGNYKVRVDTLQDYIESKQIQKVDLLKVDVEGFEIQVLEGVRNRLTDIDVIMCEARFGPHEYPGVQISELIEFLLDFDFRFLALYNDTSAKSKVFNYGDALFTNNA